MRMRKTWWIPVLICLLCLILPLATTAAEDTERIAATEVETGLTDGGFYRICNCATGGMIRTTADVAEAGDGRILCEKTSDLLPTVCRVTAEADGSYLLRPVDPAGDYVFGYENERPDELSLYPEETAGENAFRILKGKDGYRLSPSRADENVLFLTLRMTEDGEAIPVFSTADGTYDTWDIRPYQPEGFRLSENSVCTSVYTAYADLRARTDEAAFERYVEWTSSDRHIAIVDRDGKFCTLCAGEVTLTARLGEQTLSCRVSVAEGQSYIWYSQKNMTEGGWNGAAVYNIRFYSGGVTKRFAIDKQVKSTDWLSEGCAVCSIAMVLHNMGARYADGYDFRSGIDGNLIADPYTVALANTGNRGAEKATATLYGDPVHANHRGIASRFFVDGKPVTVALSGKVSKQNIKEALDKNPWGVVVRFENSYCGVHYITFNRCINPEAENPNDYRFMVSDPASHDAEGADNVLFEESFAYQRLRYRMSHANLLQVWSYEK